MSEKRFIVESVEIFECGEFDKRIVKAITDKNELYTYSDIYEIADLLNEQQATIQRMKHSLNTIYKAFEKHYGYDMRNAVWLIDELSYDEIVDELYIAETDSKNRKESSMYWKNKCDEQQDTIKKLQDLCGESDGENAKLRIENKKLKAKLKEKEEDERLYANEIVELRKTNEEWLQFKSLGGDY